MCDHTIAYMNVFIVQSEVADIVKNEAYGWNTYSKTMNSLTRGSEKALKEDYTGKDFLDRRKNMMTIFNNCPYCGEKINWREIKKTI